MRFFEIIIDVVCLLIFSFVLVISTGFWISALCLFMFFVVVIDLFNQ